MKKLDEEKLKEIDKMIKEGNLDQAQKEIDKLRKELNSSLTKTRESFWNTIS